MLPLLLWKSTEDKKVQGLIFVTSLLKLKWLLLIFFIICIGAIHMLRYTHQGLMFFASHFFSSDPSWTPKTQPNNSRAVFWLSFWCSTRPSADTVTNLNRAHYHQLVIIMLKSSYHNEFFIGDRVWCRHHIMKTSTWQAPTDDKVLRIN